MTDKNEKRSDAPYAASIKKPRAATRDEVDRAKKDPDSWWKKIGNGVDSVRDVVKNPRKHAASFFGRPVSHLHVGAQDHSATDVQTVFNPHAASADAYQTVAGPFWAMFKRGGSSAIGSAAHAIPHDAPTAFVGNSGHQKFSSVKDEPPPSPPKTPEPEKVHAATKVAAQAAAPNSVAPSGSTPKNATIADIVPVTPKTANDNGKTGMFAQTGAEPFPGSINTERLADLTEPKPSVVKPGAIAKPATRRDSDIER